jgi:hypothetical protein
MVPSVAQQKGGGESSIVSIMAVAGSSHKWLVK